MMMLMAMMRMKRRKRRRVITNVRMKITIMITYKDQVAFGNLLQSRIVAGCRPKSWPDCEDRKLGEITENGGMPLHNLFVFNIAFKN